MLSVPMSKSIHGRTGNDTGNYFVLPGGRRLGLLRDERYDVSSVAEWQLIQKAPDLFPMCVVPAQGYSSAGSE